MQLDNVDDWELLKEAWRFPLRKYVPGWGLPVCWQGWLVEIAYPLLLIGASPLFFLTPHQWCYVPYAAPLAVALACVVWIKGEKIRRRGRNESRAQAMLEVKPRQSQDPVPAPGMPRAGRESGRNWARFAATLGKQARPAGIALVIGASLCLRSYGAPSEEMVDAAMFQQGYGVTVRSYPVSHGAMKFPTPRAQKIPDYPIEMRRHGVSGIVVLRVAVGSDGIPRLRNVLWASQAEFEKAARDAVGSWIFFPAESDGHAVEVELDYKFEFKVQSRE